MLPAALLHFVQGLHWQSMLVCYLVGVSAVISGRQLAACCTAGSYVVLLRASFINVVLHLACISGVAAPLQPGQ